jgi:hypothetical protein
MSSKSIAVRRHSCAEPFSTTDSGQLTSLSALPATCGPNSFFMALSMSSKAEPFPVEPSERRQLLAQILAKGVLRVQVREQRPDVAADSQLDQKPDDECLANS